MGEPMNDNVTPKKRKKIVKHIKPVNNKVLIRHDKDLEKTAGGILLPDTAKIHLATGIIISMQESMKDNHHDYPFKEGDRIVYDLSSRRPYNSDPHDRLFFINASDILATEEEEEIEIDEDEPKQEAKPNVD